MKDEKTALSYWFPKIEAAGLPVPRTTIVKMRREAQLEMLEFLDGDRGGGQHLREFTAELTKAAAEIGYPVFLRTDYTSGKHDWRHTCFILEAAVIPSHVSALIEYSEMVDIMGLPWDTWVVREFLLTMPLAVCPHYGLMPVCREFRFFVDGGDVLCFHPYWPRQALTEGGIEDPAAIYERLCEMENLPELSALASSAGASVGGAWSVDLLETERGWFVTDMAEAEKSFHWEDCPAKP